ncbi:MAG: aminotransferase class I/II-fold pyridoxal phosphate-dependent enzyme [Firmicutes bacterium]|nr:aminotransferase class I/II-fold pyridoxal phosphate-dependent enzyme [Bacillota bacterium]
MEDQEILRLFNARKEAAIRESRRKFGPLIRSLALRLLGSREDAEETENDTYMKVWTAVPPAQPLPLAPYFSAVCRRTALDRLRARTREKRGAGAYEESLSELAEVTAGKGWTYSRTRNPNRAALAEAISYLEGGEASLIFASGMGAITVPMITLLQPGDRVLCNANIYGETFSTLRDILSKMGVETDFVDYLDMDAVRAAIRPETKMIYSEVVSNPTVKIADIPALAELAHKNGAWLMVDNTFTSPFAIRPMDFGADIVINSLTKFLNGHADAMGGSMTTTAELVDKIRPYSMLVGTPGDAFSSWLILRGLRTAELRIPRQIKTAEKLAAFFAADPRISAVNHPSLATGAQKELADKLFGENGSTPMMSFVLPEDIEKVDAFMKALRFTRYAPTLGGLRTTMSHPVTSSHFSMPDEERRKIGITPGMIRLSVGLEDPDDLIADFSNALRVFD